MKLPTPRELAMEQPSYSRPFRKGAAAAYAAVEKALRGEEVAMRVGATKEQRAFTQGLNAGYKEIADAIRQAMEEK